MQEYTTPKRSMIGLGIAFIAILAIGVWTVLIPELKNAEESEQSTTQLAD